MTNQSPTSPSAATPRPPVGRSSVARPPGARPPFDRRLAAAVQKVTAHALGPYQTAIVRIGFSLTWLLFLLREWPHRLELYGPDSPWSWQMGRRLIADNHSFSVLMWSDGRLWFETVYALAVLSAVLLLLGWRTRAVSVVFMAGVLSLQNRAIFMGDGGDNVIHIMSLYLVLTRCAQVWSLDARRAARGEKGGRFVGPLLWTLLGGFLLAATWFSDVTGEWWLLVLLWVLWLGHGLWWLVCRYAPDEPRTLLDVVANLAHNATFVVIMAEVCLIYATAGWYKVQGSRWQDGTALYFPLHLDYFSPWPALSGMLGDSGTMVLLLTYGTVIVQVAFPFTLFNRKVKNVLLAAMMLEHAGIALLLGLPFFSLAMIAADAVFLPTGFLVWAEARVARGRDRALGRFGWSGWSGWSGRTAGAAPALASGSVSVPGPGGPGGEAGPRTLVG